MIKITFPDGAVKEYEQGITAYQIAEGISPRLAADVIVATVNGEIYDLDRPINTDASLKLHKWEDKEAKKAFWHSSSHLMAEALEALYPGIKFGIGPAIDNGFYYDVDLGDRQISDADLARIEAKMLELARSKERFVRTEVAKADAMANFKAKGDQYKCELIDGLEDGTISFYTNGNFTDLCRGPHLRDTSMIKAIKLLNIAGAYWRGDEHNKMLTRIYGITFPKKSMLDEYLVMLEEAKKRDHRKLGREMELFTFSNRVGQGLPLWLPKGADLRNRLQEFLQKVQKKYGYLPVITPHIGSKDLYVTSGHWAHYGADSFRPITTPQ
ncbi:MAG: TGS domain-containing protein, partial [Bacteroidales bacterium]|nr:TGS domain-containing protein [Bacteroidales bacterium]